MLTEGIKKELRKNHPWVTYLWCVAHRLELALKDVLQGTSFDDVDELLLRLYYLYENLPKKLRKLRELHHIYCNTFEFEEGEVQPNRASGDFIILVFIMYLSIFHQSLHYLLINS